jgi:hypothetical protein
MKLFSFLNWRIPAESLILFVAEESNFSFFVSFQQITNQGGLTQFINDLVPTNVQPPANIINCFCVYDSLYIKPTTTKKFLFLISFAMNYELRDDLTLLLER